MGLIWENEFAVFLGLTVVLGGGAAWMAGRGMALKWRPIGRLVFFMLLLAGAVRFFHFGLFGGSLLSLHYYAVDAVVLIVIALLGYRVTRTSQMANQYRWLYRRTSPLTWEERA